MVIPVWPVLADSFVIDGGGTVHALVTNGDVSYVVTPAQ
jgi:hypothetical protein